MENLLTIFAETFLGKLGVAKMGINAKDQAFELSASRAPKGARHRHAGPQGANHQTSSYRDATRRGTLKSSSNSFFVSRNEDAAIFCSRCCAEEVPGMGSILGER